MKESRSCHNSKSNSWVPKRIRRRKIAFIWLHDRYVERSVRKRARQNNSTRETNSRIVRLIFNVLKRILPRRNARTFSFSLDPSVRHFYFSLYAKYNAVDRYLFIYKKIMHLFQYRSVNTLFNLKILRYYKSKNHKSLILFSLNLY